MKKRILFFLVLFCTIPAMAQLNYDAVIVGETVRIRSDANVNSKVLKTMNTGDVVKIISKTDKRVVIPLSNDICDEYGYYWYKIKGLDGQTGYVYGAFLYIIEVFNNKYFENVYASSFSLGGKDFYYDFAEVNSIGITNDESGLIECDQLKIPFLYDKKDSKIFPIQFVKSYIKSVSPFKTTKDKNWLLLTSSMGISENVNTIKLLGDTPVLLIKRNFQDSSADAIFKLTLKDTYFEAVLIDYKTYY